jgi:CO dehydrogenase nickel-insertion accessory protein CooC1
MANEIVAMGRGGARKSTFVALVKRYLKPPILLITFNLDLSLADMLGFDFRKKAGYKLQN